MYVIALSVNYKQASVEERELVAFNDSDLVDALHVLRAQKSVLESVVLSTCNRTEVYIVADQLHTGKYYIQQFLANYFNVDIELIKKFTIIRTENAAIEHLFRVTAGLDSMVLGETQILGQMRDSFLLAQNEGTTGTVFNRLFKDVITIAKRGHNETDISKNPISISYAAVELVKKLYDNFKDKNIVVVGAGQMAEQSLLNVAATGADNVTVVNRSVENAAKLAGQFGYKSAPLSELAELMKDADLVISSTSAEGYIVEKSHVDEVMPDRAEQPLVLMDIALPRDIDPEIETLENVYAYNVDDLQNIVDSNLASRQVEARKIEEMISEAMDAFNEWVKMLGVVPIIQAMRTRALNIQNQTLESLKNKLPDLNERERKVISKHMKSIINQMLKDPIIFTKEIVNEENSEERLQDIKKLFNIEEEVEQQTKEDNMSSVS